MNRCYGFMKGKWQKDFLFCYVLTWCVLVCLILVKLFHWLGHSASSFMSIFGFIIFLIRILGGNSMSISTFILQYCSLRTDLIFHIYPRNKSVLCFVFIEFFTRCVIEYQREHIFIVLLHSCFSMSFPFTFQSIKSLPQ